MAAQTMGQNIEPTSGPDQDGPIWGYHFVPNQPAQAITSEAAVEFLTAPGPGMPNEFLWLHFSLSNVTSEPWLRRHREHLTPGLSGAFLHLPFPCLCDSRVDSGLSRERLNRKDRSG